MPKYGTPASSTDRSSRTASSVAPGSPGPLEKNTPSGCRASTWAQLLVAGTTCTSMPRSAIRYGVIVLIPRSTATTRNRASPCALTTYGFGVVTSSARCAPDISGADRTRASSAAGSVSTLETPTRMAPRSRRWRVSARVPEMAMPTTPCSLR